MFVIQQLPARLKVQAEQGIVINCVCVCPSAAR